MADNKQLSAGSADGAVIATDEISGADYQRVKISDGVADSVVHLGIVADDAAVVAADTGILAMAVATPTDTSVDANDTGFMGMSTDRRLHTDSDMQINGTAITANAGAAAASTPRVTLASDDPAVAKLGTIDTDTGTIAGDTTSIDAKLVSGTVIGEVEIGAASTATGDLAKARDAATAGTDVGVGMLARHREDLIHLTSADDDYDLLTLDSLGQLHVNPEGHHVFSDFNTETDFAVLDDATGSIASSANHVMGTTAVSFAKINGTGGTSGCIDDTITSVDLGDVSPHDIIQTSCYLSSLTNVSYVFVRLGDTDATNYNEWRIDVSDLTAGIWETLLFNVGDPAHGGSTGTGWNPAAIDYIAVGVEFASESDTLAGILFDQLSYHTNQHTSAQLNAEVSSSVSSPNVKLNGYGGNTDTGAGAVSANTLRATLGSDDPAVVDLASIQTATEATQTAVELIDDAIYVDDADWTDGSSKHMLTGGLYQSSPQTITDGDVAPFQVTSTGALLVSGGGGGTEYTENEVTANPIVGTATLIERDDVLTTPVAEADWMGLKGSAEGALWTQDFNSDAILADTAAMVVDLAAIEVTQNTIAGAVSGSEMQVDIVAALPAGTAAIGKLAANSGVDIGDVDVLSLPASTNTLEVVGDVAHDAVVAGNPVLAGGRAVASIESQTEVGAGDASFINTDLSGTLITTPFVAAQQTISYHVVNTAGTELTITGLDAGGAGIHNYVTTIIVHNAHASTNGFIQLLDGSAGTVLMTIPAPATGGATINLPLPLRQPTANTALFWDASAAITTLYVTIIGYQGQG